MANQKISIQTIRKAFLRVITGTTATVFIAWAAYRFHLNLSTVTSLHLFLVTAIALRWGLLEASVVSVMAVASLDYYFMPPLFSFYITDSRDLVALVTFEGVALLVSRLSNQLNTHVHESETHRSQLQELYELSQNILLLDQKKPVDQQLADLIQTTLHVKGVALWNAYDLHLSTSGTCNDTEDGVRSICFTEINQDDLEAGVSQRVLRSGTRAIGSLLISGHTLNAASLNAAASLTAVAIERARSFSAESSAEASRQSEQLRSAVLDGLAHAFKTPLATILSSSSGLLELDTLSDTEKKLLTLIDQQAGHLSDLTTHLLLTARIDSAHLKVRHELVDVTRLILDTLEALSQELIAHPVNMHARDQRRLVWADKQLLKMALFQLLDNATKYGDPASAITIDVQEEQAETLISIRNEGSFIPPEERGKIFRRFYRSPASARMTSGTGIGLSVVKRITEAHHGRVWVDSDLHIGTTFFLALPKTTMEK